MTRLLYVFGVVILLAAGSVQGSTIPVGDSGFEQSIVPSGGGSAPNNGSPWVATVTGTDTTSWTIFSPAGFLPGNHGDVANIDSSANESDKTSLTQTLSVNVQPKTTYTLGFDVIARPDMLIAPAYGVQLLDGAATLVSVNNPLVATTTWQTASYSFTTGATVGGGALGIEFFGESFYNGSWNKSQTFFDNVTMSSTPEPSSLVLLVCGVIGLLAYAWRRGR